MKRFLAALIACTLIFSLTACGGGNSSPAPSSTAPESKTESSTAPQTTAKPGEGIKVALIASSSGLGDRSFNDSAWAGFEKAAEEFGVEIKAIEPKSPADYVTSATSLANGGYDLIFAVGNDWGDTIKEVAPQFPDTKWLGLNYDAEGDNVLIARTADPEIGFLAGALAAMVSESNTVGFIGGKDVPSINRMEVGYEEGAKYVNPDITYYGTYVGAFDDPVKGKEFALQLISQGADVIFHAAGKSGEGLFEAVRSTDGVYAIGVDSNQDYIVEGRVLTTAQKRLDIISYETIKSVVEGSFEAGNKVYGLAEGGVSLTDFEFTKDVIGEENLNAIKELQDKIISGEIKVTDIYNQ